MSVYNRNQLNIVLDKLAFHKNFTEDGNIIHTFYASRWWYALFRNRSTERLIGGALVVGNIGIIGII